jgi:hypothetical protein
MKNLFMFSFFSCFCIFSNAQSINSSVIGSAGDIFVTSSIIQEFTVGELMVETFIAAPFVLSQGFHQEDFILLPAELLLSGVVASYGDTLCFAALQNVFIEDFMAKDGAKVIFIAGNKILMSNNVVVESGASMVLKIDNQGLFCDGFKTVPSILSTCPEMELSSTEVLSGKIGMIFYPNPVRSFLTIELDAIHDQTLVTIDFIGLLGQNELSITITNTAKHQTDVSMLPSGIYIVRVTTPNEVFIGKIIKQ